MKKNLVIIAAGSDALFQEWADYSIYDFDLAVILWDHFEIKNTENAKFVETIQGHKWKIISQFAKKHDLSGYEYIWTLDDDCLTTSKSVDDTFKFCKENNIDLAQPALTPDSYYAHPPTVLVHGAKMHITNTVEIMCPIFSQRAWTVCTSYLDKMPLGIGFGLEGVWTQDLECQNGTTKFGGQVAVIDRYPVKHTRKITYMKDYQARGLNPLDDFNYFKNLGYGWSFHTLRVINE